jgi:hypothetical protein
MTATITSPSGVVNSGTVNFSVTFSPNSPSTYSASAPVVNGIASASVIIPAGDFFATPGSYPITAAYVPSGILLASSDNTKQLTISKAPLVITWATPAPIANGTPLEFGQLNAGFSPGIAYATCVYTPPLGTVLPGPGTYTLSVTCTAQSAEYIPATATVSIQVTMMTALTVTWANPAPIVNGTPLGAAQLNAVASPSAALATCVYTPALGTVLSGPGAYSLSVTCTPASSEQSSYSATTATVSILVTAPLTITWANPAPIANGTPLVSQLNAIASPGTAYATCAYNPTLGTVLPGPGVYTLSVTCTPNILEQSIYTAATATVSITVTPQVAKIPLTMTWATPAPIGNGAPLGSDQLNAIASPSAASASCVYTPPSGTVLAGPGTYTLSVTCTPASGQLANYTAATATVSIQVLSITRAIPTIYWATPAAITAGTALSGTQLNAAAATGAPFGFTVPGTFVYSPPMGTVLPVGNNEALTVTFTPTDTTSYQTATAKVYITVISTDVGVSVETAIIPFSASPTSAILTANVTKASSTGGVAFTVLGQATSQAGIVNGVASAIVTIPGGTQAGSYPIVANYSDPIYPSITASGTANLVVSPPKVTIAANNFATPYSASASVVTLTANVANATASGYVLFQSPAGTSNGAVAHVVNGVAIGSFTISAGTLPGNYPITADYTDPLNLGVFASGTATLNIGLITPSVNWPTPGAIFNGTALSSAQLNATANVPGTFVYNPPAGTVLPVGYYFPQVLSVTFTPANPALYTTAAATVPIYVVPSVTVVPANITLPYSPASQTIIATPEVANVYSPNYTLTFSLLGSSTVATPPFSTITLTVPSGTPVGTYPFVVTYADSYWGLTATGTSQLTITEPSAGSCPTSSTSSESSAQFKIPGAPNGSVLNPKDLNVALTRWNGLKRNDDPTLSPDGMMIGGGIQQVAPICPGTPAECSSYELSGTITTEGNLPPVMLTGGGITLTGAGGTQTGTLPPSTTPIVGCEATPFVATVSGASLAPGSSAIASLSATLQDPVTQNVFQLQLTQRITLSGSTASASATPEARGKLVAARLLAPSGAASVTMDSPALAGLPGATLTFSGTLANSSGADQYINGAEIILNGFSSTNSDATGFLLNAPLILTNGTTTSSFDFFTVTIPTQFASGPYSGQLGIFGGSTSSDQNLLGIVNFTVQVGGAVTSPNSSCDITGDGVTSVADVQAIINQALGTSPPVTGDLNGDGAVNLVDIQFVINAALNLGCAADQASQITKAALGR